MSKIHSQKKTDEIPQAASPDPRSQRRRRLLAAAQGRRLDEMYVNFPEIRAAIEAEAADGDPDALVTPDMLQHLHELIARKHTVVGRAAARRGARTVKATPALALDRRVLNTLSAKGARALPAAPSGARGAVLPPPGVDVFAAPRLFFSTDTVVIVPGLLASSLGDTQPGGYGLIWVDPLLSIHDKLGELQLGKYDGSERDHDPAALIHAQGALPYFYDLLRIDLEVHRYTVELFGFDWRKHIEISAGMLAARLRALAGQSSRPIHVVAHSQGALVARRALQVLGPAQAKRIARHLVLLGPANFGSFSAAFAVAGNHSLLPMLRRLAIEPRQGFQAVLASMSGIYQLLPFDRDRTPWLAQNDYSKPGFWKVPIDTDRLTQFYAWARSINTDFLNDRTAVILGDNHGAPTTGGVAFEGALLKNAPAFALPGDGTVPHSCSVLPGTKTYLAPNTEHSMLATYRNVIDAVRDVLAARKVGLAEVSSNPADHLNAQPGAAHPSVAAGMRTGAAPKGKSAIRPGRRTGRSRTPRSGKK